MVATSNEVVWRPLFQQTVDAYYAGDLDRGRAACERLLSLDGLPPHIRVQARRNATFYAPPLATSAPGLRLTDVVIPVPEGWSCFNPSIAAAPDGFRMIVRSSNYVVSPRLHYTVNDRGGVFRTKNYLLTLDFALQARGIEPIDDGDVAPPREPPNFPVVGFEDCRLIDDRGTWRVVGTSREWNPRGVCQMALMRLTGTTLHDLRLLNDDRAGVHEKNWMPAVTPDGLRFIYACNPTVLLRFDEQTRSIVEELRRAAPTIAIDFRGGSQAIPVDGGWLCVIHESVNFADGSRVYPHRFVWFDADWNLTRCSPPFFWRERGIEYGAGLARDGDRVLVSFGVWDREAWLAELPLAEALALLRPFEPPAVAADAPATNVVPDPMADPGQDGFTPFPPALPLVSVTLAGNGSAALIGDALRSVADWVEACIVLDTGIADDTLAVARAVAGDKLVVRSFPWIDDFAAARNGALEAAAAWGADWAVILDTDERIDLGDVDVRAALAASDLDVVSIAYADGSYAKERFFRMPARGEFHGPTHEAFFHAGRRGDLAGPVFREEPKSADGYRRKAERDIAILTRHTAEHPDDPRWFYYLGDALANLQRREDAITAFERCWALQGWDEEGAWAMYRAARCWLELGERDRAIEACAAGMARHAGLAELPWLAAFASWQAGRDAQAVYWARMSAAMGLPFGAGASVPRIGFRHPPALYEGPYDVLRYALRRLGDAAGADEAERQFHRARSLREGRRDAATTSDDPSGIDVSTPSASAASGAEDASPARQPAAEPPVATAWQTLFDRSVAAYYEGRQAEGRSASEALASLPDVPVGIRAQNRRNQIFYARSLPALVDSLDVIPVRFPTSPGWSRFNPSIATSADGFRMIVRSANYRRDRWSFHILDPDQIIRTTNYLLDLNRDFSIRDVRPLVDRTAEDSRFPSPAIGFEDCRLLRWQDAWHVSSTVLDRNPAHVAQVALVRIEGDEWRDPVLLSDAANGRHEKNWMPFLAGDDLCFVYACRPTTIFRYDASSRSVATIATRPGPLIAAEFRGGSQGIQLADGWLFAIHESVEFEDRSRVMPHRFIHMDDQFRIVACSPQFFFAERSIEFCGGLAARDGMLIASVGRNDRDTMLVVMHLDEALGMLEPIIDVASESEDRR